MAATTEYHGAPICRCGSRATKRVGWLVRTCQECKQTYHYRLHDGRLVPMTRDVAMALDEERQCLT